MADITSNSSSHQSDRQPYDPNYVNRVLRAKDHELLTMLRVSQRKWEKHMRSTPELRQKYDVR